MQHLPHPPFTPILAQEEENEFDIKVIYFLLFHVMSHMRFKITRHAEFVLIQVWKFSHISHVREVQSMVNSHS